MSTNGSNSHFVSKAVPMKLCDAYVGCRLELVPLLICLSFFPLDAHVVYGGGMRCACHKGYHGYITIAISNMTSEGIRVLAMISSGFFSECPHKEKLLPLSTSFFSFSLFSFPLSLSLCPLTNLFISLSVSLSVSRSLALSLSLSLRVRPSGVFWNIPAEVAPD